MGKIKKSVRFSDTIVKKTIEATATDDTIDDKIVTKNDDKKLHRVANVKFKATQKHKENKSAFTKLNKPETTSKIQQEQLKQIKNDLVKTSVDNSLVKKITDLKPKSILKHLKDDTSDGKVGKNLKKIDKRKIKKNLWMKKVDFIKGELKEIKEKKKREKTVIVGDMKQLADTLPTDILPKSATKRQKKVNIEKPRSIQKEAKRAKQTKDDVQLFSQLIDYKQFTSNPLDTLKKYFDTKKS